MSTPGSTWNILPPNSAIPTTYCTGSPCSSLCIIVFNAAWSSADSSSALPQTMSVHVRPKRTSSSKRTMPFASPSPYNVVSCCHSLLYIAVFSCKSIEKSRKSKTFGFIFSVFNLMPRIVSYLKISCANSWRLRRQVCHSCAVSLLRGTACSPGCWKLV